LLEYFFKLQVLPEISAAVQQLNYKMAAARWEALSSKEKIVPLIRQNRFFVFFLKKCLPI